MNWRIAPTEFNFGSFIPLDFCSVETTKTAKILRTISSYFEISFKVVFLFCKIYSRKGLSLRHPLWLVVSFY